MTSEVFTFLLTSGTIFGVSIFLLLLGVGADRTRDVRRMGAHGVNLVALEWDVALYGRISEGDRIFVVDDISENGDILEGEGKFFWGVLCEIILLVLHDKEIEDGESCGCAYWISLERTGLS